MSDADPQETLAKMIMDRNLPYIVRYAAMHDLIAQWGVLAGTNDADILNETCSVGMRILKDGYHAPCVGHV